MVKWGSYPDTDILPPCKLCSKQALSIGGGLCSDCLISELLSGIVINYPKKNLWTRYWDWYGRNIGKSMLITLAIMVSQIPHFIWAGDAYLQTGYIAHVNPIADFILYGIDLIEIPLILKTVVDAYILLRRR